MLPKVVKTPLSLIPDKSVSTTVETEIVVEPMEMEAYLLVPESVRMNAEWNSIWFDARLLLPDDWGYACIVELWSLDFLVEMCKENNNKNTHNTTKYALW